MTKRTIDPADLTPETRAMLADVKAAVNLFERTFGHLPDDDTFDKLVVVICRYRGWPETSFPPALRLH